MNPYPRSWVDIDLPALASNVRAIRSRVGADALVALVAKADAYGHGLVPVARRAIREGVDWIAVATVQEGIALRDAGIQSPILVLSPILPIEADQAVFYDLRLQIDDPFIAQALDRAASEQGRTAHVHLKIDTGLARFGCRPEEVANMLAQIRALKHIEVEGAATHFIDSGKDPAMTRAQLERLPMDDLRDLLVHVSNSAGAMLYPEFPRRLVRIGIAAYGIDPYAMFEPGELTPVLTWKARVMSLRSRDAGWTVSYAATRQLDRPSRLATLGVGYGDGYPRSLSNRAWAMIRGVRCPVMGLVCMDQTVVDVTDAPYVELGDEATLIGEGVTVEHLAEAGQTNCHEIVTRIMSRVPRRYRHES